MNKLRISLFLIFFTALHAYNLCSENPDTASSSETFSDQCKTPINAEELPTDPSLSSYSVSDYIKLLKQASYYGQWAKFDSTSPQPFTWNSDHGVFVMETLELPDGENQDSNYSTKQNTTKSNFRRLSTPSIEAQNNTKLFDDSNKILQVALKTYDGEFLDGQSFRVFYNLASINNLSFDSNTTTLYDSSSIVKTYYSVSGTQDADYRNCDVNISFTFLNKETGAPFSDLSAGINSLGLNVTVISDDCGFVLETAILTTNGFLDMAEVWFYVLVSCVTSTLSIIGLYTLKKTFQKQSRVYYFSPASIWLMVAIDYYLLILNLVLIFAYSPFITIAFAYNVLLTFVLEKDLLLRIMHINSSRNNTQNADEDCRSCGWHFGLAAIFFIFELVFVLMYQLWVLYFTALIFVPQIIHNFKREKPYKFSFTYNIFLNIPRILFIAYMRLYPHNIFKVSPDQGFMAIYISLIAVQILALAVQTKFPKFFFGTSVAVRKNSRLLTEEDICPICMGHLSSSIDISPTLPRRPTIETTCTHSFHIPCLKKWAINKTECPLCRNDIGDILEDLDLEDTEDTRV